MALATPGSLAPRPCVRPFTLPLLRSRLTFLLHRSVAALNVKDISEVDWASFDDPALKPHGPKNLHDRWRSLSRKAQKRLLKADDSLEYDHAGAVPLYISLSREK